jgi:hypothetical protein
MRWVDDDDGKAFTQGRCPPPSAHRTVVGVLLPRPLQCAGQRLLLQPRREHQQQRPQQPVVERAPVKLGKGRGGGGGAL